MNKKNSFTLSLLLSVGLSTITFANEIETNSAIMQSMDKITGRVKKITVPVNSKISYGDFSLVLRACKKRPAEETPENFAFVDVADKSFGDNEYNIFRGWMVSSTPGINAIEHPIYDVWLLECVDTEVDEKLLLSKEDLMLRDSLPTKEFMQKQIKNTKQEEKIEPKKVIRIREFITEDRDIEKDIETPAYISDTSAQYVSDIEEGAEPENLLQFTNIQQVEEDSTKNEEPEDSLNNAIDKELELLNKD